jgi:hypothetical protein
MAAQAGCGPSSIQCWFIVAAVHCGVMGCCYWSWQMAGVVSWDRKRWVKGVMEEFCVKVLKLEIINS